MGRDHAERGGLLGAPLDPPAPSELLEHDVESPRSDRRRSPASVRHVTARRAFGCDGGITTVTSPPRDDVVDAIERTVVRHGGILRRRGPDQRQHGQRRAQHHRGERDSEHDDGDPSPPTVCSCRRRAAGRVRLRRGDAPVLHGQPSIRGSWYRPRRGPVPQGRCGTGPGSTQVAFDPSGTLRTVASDGDG